MAASKPSGIKDTWLTVSRAFAERGIALLAQGLALRASEDIFWKLLRFDGLQQRPNVARLREHRCQDHAASVRWQSVPAPRREQVPRRGVCRQTNEGTDSRQLQFGRLGSNQHRQQRGASLCGFRIRQETNGGFA